MKKLVGVVVVVLFAAVCQGSQNPTADQYRTPHDIAGQTIPVAVFGGRFRSRCTSGSCAMSPSAQAPFVPIAEVITTKAKSRTVVKTRRQPVRRLFVRLFRVGR